MVSAGWAGQGGKQVRIRHDRGVETFYLHLSSFAPGIRAGASVDQNQIIGRVGSTGAATGPHLDFRLRKNGVFVDPGGPGQGGVITINCGAADPLAGWTIVESGGQGTGAGSVTAEGSDLVMREGNSFLVAI